MSLLSKHSLSQQIENDSTHFLNFLKANRAQIFVIGQDKNKRLNDLELDIIQFLYWNKGIRVVAYDAPLIFEDIINDYVVKGVDRFDLLQESINSKRIFKEYFSYIKDFNSKLEITERIHFRCFQVSTIDDSKFVQILYSKYKDHQSLSNSNLISYLKNIQHIKVNVIHLDTLLNMCNNDHFEIEYTRIKQLVSNQIESDKINYIPKSDLHSVQMKFILSKILNIRHDSPSFCISTNLHQSVRVFQDSSLHNSLTSLLIHDNNLDVVSFYLLTLSKSKKRSNLLILKGLLTEELKTLNFKKGSLYFFRREDLNPKYKTQPDFVLIDVRQNISRRFWKKVESK